MGGLVSKDKPPPQTVLVPPLFERDHKGRSRFVKSSYDWQFGKPALKWLFSDYIHDGASSILRFRPSEDPRVTVKAHFQTGMQPLGAGSAGAVSLRFQPVVEEPMTFVDVKAAARGTGGAQARACWFDASRGVGVFGVAPVMRAQTSAPPDIRVGLRYSSPIAAAGVVLQPLRQSIHQAWLVGRQGAFSYGLQIDPSAVPDSGMKDVQGQVQGQPELGNLAADLQRCTSYAVAYSPEPTTPGRGSFTAALELVGARQLNISFFHHLAVQRLVKNPFEDRAVVGITNYIDLGLQVETDLVVHPTLGDGAMNGNSPYSRASLDAAAADSRLRLGASWQVNKNWLLKARLGSDCAALSAAFKAWWQPSFTFALSALYDFERRAPRLGAVLNVENYGNMRYERSRERLQPTGRAVVQRHVALPEEIANKEGRGLLVQKEDIDNKAILGQVDPVSASYM